MKTIFVNGKFLLQRRTGVQRAACEWLNAVDRLLGEDLSARERWVVLHPPGARLPPWQCIEARPVGRPGGSLLVWEQWTLPRAARAGMLLNLAGSAPWLARRQVATLHDAAVWDQPQAYTWLFRTWYRALFRHLARRASRLLTVSAFSRERLAACLGEPPQRFTVLANGADHLNEIGADVGALGRVEPISQGFLLAVASANPSKNLARLVEAFGRLDRSEGLRLVIVGGSNLRVFAGARLPPTDGVVRLGAVDDTALKALYCHAHALIVPSLYEGFGLPPLEAMSCGCPVAAARAAALPEVCGEAALYFDPYSVDDIAAALHRMVDDSRLRDGLRQAGQARAAGFTWRAAGERLRKAMRDEVSSTP
jgi:glycosyltransferase involved in cell wall biosynthesis